MHIALEILFPLFLFIFINFLKLYAKCNNVPQKEDLKIN